VENVGGGGVYYAQLAQGDDYLESAPIEVSMESNEIVAVRDTFLEAGKTYRFTLSPGSALMDADLFLMDSLPTTESTWVKSRAQSLDSAFAPIGQAVVLEIAITRSDWYGLVVQRQGVNGTYDLTRTTL
jgi:hypothetical protein